MKKNNIIAVLIILILVGVGIFAFDISKAVSYAAIGAVIVGFIGLLVATRKKKQ